MTQFQTEVPDPHQNDRFYSPPKQLGIKTTDGPYRLKRFICQEDVLAYPKTGKVGLRS